MLEGLEQKGAEAECAGDSGKIHVEDLGGDRRGVHVGAEGSGGDDGGKGMSSESGASRGSQLRMTNSSWKGRE